MAAQTELLSRAANQARSDARDSAIVTAKQLSGLQAQITAAQDGTKALQGHLNQARRSAGIASRQLELTDRAWIKVDDVKPRGDKPPATALTFRNLVFPDLDPSRQEAYLNFEVHYMNVGHAAALNIQVWDKLFLTQWTDGYSGRVEAETKRFCDSVTQKKNTVTGGGPALYPGEPHTVYQGVSGIVTKENMTSFSDTPGQYILPVLIGCIDYQYQSSNSPHQTRFVYEAFHAQGPRTRFFLIGVGTAANDITLLRNESDDYAN